MPNLFSAFTNDVFRPLATLLIPGAIGVSTWIVALVLRFPALSGLMAKNHGESVLVLLLATVFAGMVFEDLGARWEVQLDRWADERTDGEHSRNWNRYLQMAFIADPVGRRYARAMVLRLKFELGAGIGMIFGAWGLIWLAFLGLSIFTVICIGALCVAFAIWSLVEAKETHKVLSKTRAVLLGDIRVVGNR